MIFSNQKWFCICCGKELFSPFVHAMGRKYKVCSYECLREMDWRETLCIMGKDYYPQPKKEA